MSHRRTVPRNSPGHSPEGGGSCFDGLFSLWKCPSLCNAQNRRWLACFSGTLTMCLVGTVYGWTRTSFPPLTTGIGDVSLKLTHDEYSWSVSLTVLSSMIGSLLAAELADRIGRKYCLFASSIMFTVGWLHMYSTTSVPMLFFARGILGIGVGIARTINPMFVSEVADIKFRGSLGTLIAANVYFGSLLTYAPGPSLTYRSHLLYLAVISAISILPLICLRETPYFLVAKGKKEQASKSIAYYKGIEDPDQVKDELRALRAEARYGLHQQSRRDLPPPYSINLSSPSSGDLPPPYSAILSPPSSRDLPPPYPGNLPSQSIRETHSDPTREVVDTQATSDLDLPSNSDSHSQSISSVYSKFKCEVRTQTTGKLRVKYSRISPGSPLQTSRELHSQSASDLHRPSTSQIRRPPTSQIHPDPTREVVDTEATPDLDLPTSSDSHSQSISSVHSEYICQIHTQPTGAVHVEYSRDSPGLPLQTSRELCSQSASDLHRPATSQIRRPSTSQILPETRSELYSRARSDLRTESRADSRASTDISEPYMNLTKYTCLDKLRALQQRSNRKALFILLGLIMIQHLSGNFITTQYLEDFISTRTTSFGLYNALIWIEILRLLCGYLTALIVNRCGRKKLLMVSTIGMFYTTFVLSGYVHPPKPKSDNSVASLLLFLDLVINQIVFQIGIGTLPNVFLCDLFPTKLKGIVGAIVVIFDGIIGFTVPKLNKVITDNISWNANFTHFATSCLVAFVMTIMYIPETKGKTYNEIEALLIGENSNSSNEEVSSDEMDSTRI